MRQATDDAVATDSSDRVRYFERIKTRLLPDMPGVTEESWTGYIGYRSFLRDHDVRAERGGQPGGYLPLAVDEDGEDLVLGMLAGAGMPKSYLDTIVEDFRAMEILYSGVEIIEAYLILSGLLTEQDRRGWKDLQASLLGRRPVGDECELARENRPGPGGDSPGIPSGEIPEGQGPG